ncbi:uncharacterized protein LOC142768997 [Rhipicephalus microplus]|uniref:uncharacterized protein LOC142768997 n=1 Tax=Rhipicephalus microplus TaxID=6941 RepID=UPI003F6D8A59
MNVNIKTLSILTVAGISIAWSPISQPTAHDRRCSISQPMKVVTKCSAYRYQYDKINNRCQPVCCNSAPFSTFLECSQTCRSIEVCFIHRPRASCASGLVTVYYFSTAKGICIAELGCTYRGNNFPTLGECQKTCRAKTTAPSRTVPGVPSNIFPSHPSNGGGPSFPQQIPQFPGNRAVPPLQVEGRPSTHQQQGIQGQMTPEIMPPPGQHQLIPNASSSNLPQRPGAPGSSFPSQSNTGEMTSSPQHIPQIPQLIGSTPTIPLHNGATPSSNYQLGMQGQATSGTMLSRGHEPSNPNLVGSTTTHQQPQQPWNNVFPPVNTHTRGPGRGFQFAQQSGMQQWNGPGTSQPSPLDQSNHGMAQILSSHQLGNKNLPVSNQQPVKQPWRGDTGSHIPPQSAQHHWSNGILSPNGSRIPLLQSGSGGISGSVQPQWRNTAGTLYIQQLSQQQQVGSASAPLNVTQHPKTQMTPSNSKQEHHWSWGSGASTGGQPQTTETQPAYGVGSVRQNPSTQPPQIGNATTVSTQGVQQGQFNSSIGGVSPESQPNAVVQRIDRSNLPNLNHSTQLSSNGQPTKQQWNARMTPAGSKQNAQQHQTIAFPSQLPTSILNSNPNAGSKISIQRRVVSVQHQTAHRSMLHQTVST